MTHDATMPTRHNRSRWTAYERRRSGPPSSGFDYDALSDMTAPSLWSSSVTDWEDITILSGLTDPE